MSLAEVLKFPPLSAAGYTTAPLSGRTFQLSPPPPPINRYLVALALARQNLLIWSFWLFGFFYMAKDKLKYICRTHSWVLTSSFGFVGRTEIVANRMAPLRALWNAEFNAVAFFLKWRIVSFLNFPFYWRNWFFYAALTVTYDFTFLLAKQVYFVICHMVIWWWTVMSLEVESDIDFTHWSPPNKWISIRNQSQIPC